VRRAGAARPAVAWLGLGLGALTLFAACAGAIVAFYRLEAPFPERWLEHHEPALNAPLAAATRGEGH